MTKLSRKALHFVPVESCLKGSGLALLELDHFDALTLILYYIL